MPDNAALDMGTNSRFQPPLSATSDAPTVIQKETPTETTEEVVANTEAKDVNSDQAATDTATVSDQNADDSATSDDSGDGSAANPKKGGFQKRIDELTKQREEFRREKEEYARRLDETLSLLNRIPNEQPPHVAEPQDDPRPTRDGFDDPDAYSEALADWSTRQAIKNYENQQRVKAEQERSSSEFQKVLSTWESNRAKAIEQHPDYEAVAMNPQLQVAQHVGMALLHVPNGHEVLYYLGQHPEEAARISALGAPMAAIEIGMLSNKVATPPPVTRAPAPAKPLSGTINSAGAVTPDEDPNYMERRLQELRTKKR